MNILVLLRPVRDPAGITVNRKAQKVFVNRETFIINPSDRNALEAALQTGGTVTAVAWGGAPAEDALRLALATGAARAVQLCDPVLEQADALVLVTVLQRLVTHLGGVDLILLGADALADDTAQIAPRLAAALDWPLIDGSHQLEVNGADLTAIAAAGQGFHKLQAPLPAVIAVAHDSNKPRYPAGARLITIYQSPDVVEVLTAADLGSGRADVDVGDAAVRAVRGEEAFRFPHVGGEDG